MIRTTFENPEVVHRDVHGFMHCESGPALIYKDGRSIYAWHGVRVPKYVIETPENICEFILQEKDQLLREAMSDRYLTWKRMDNRQY